MCASVTLGAIPAGVIHLAGSTKLGRFQGRGQTKGNTCCVCIVCYRYKCAKMHSFSGVLGGLTPNFFSAPLSVLPAPPSTKGYIRPWLSASLITTISVMKNPYRSIPSTDCWNAVRALTHPASSYPTRPTRNSVAAPNQTHVLLCRVGVVM